MSVHEAKRSSAGIPVKKSAADRLCETATGLFYKHGIRAVGVDEIVTETGVTKPTLYRSFASKDDLVSVCLRMQIEEGNKRWDEIAVHFADDPAAQMRAQIASFAAEIAAPDYRGCAATNAAVEFPDPSHPARMITEDCKASLRKRMTTLTRRLKIKNPDGLADGLILLIEGASSSRHTSGSQGPASTLITTAEMLILAYLAA